MVSNIWRSANIRLNLHGKQWLPLWQFLAHLLYSCAHIRDRFLSWIVYYHNRVLASRGIWFESALPFYGLIVMTKTWSHIFLLCESVMPQTDHCSLLYMSDQYGFKKEYLSNQHLTSVLKWSPGRIQLGSLAKSGSLNVGNSTFITVAWCKAFFFKREPESIAMQYSLLAKVFLDVLWAIRQVANMEIDNVFSIGSLNGNGKRVMRVESECNKSPGCRWSGPPKNTCMDLEFQQPWISRVEPEEIWHNTIPWTVWKVEEQQPPPPLPAVVINCSVLFCPLTRSMSHSMKST